MPDYLLKSNDKKNVFNKGGFLNQQTYYVYFAIQRTLGFNHLDLKIGHSKNPKKRCYSYSDRETLCKIIACFEFFEKSLALDFERNTCKELSIIDPQSKYFDCREWFRLTEKVKKFIKNKGINCEFNL